MYKFKPLIFAVLLIILPISVFAGAKTVAIVPFKVNAEKDMNFLRDGIYDMLSSRLYQEGEVEVISRQRVEKALASVGGGVTEANVKDVGKLIGADFVLFGSLTVLGNSISVDSRMVDVTGAKPTMSFFEQSADAGGIVTRVNQMAVEINDKMFGRGTVAKSAGSGPAAATQTKPAQPKQPDTYTHPEKAFREQGGVSGEKADSPFVSEEGGRIVSPQFWKSAGMKLLFNGLALGDVDKDGQIETVILTPDKLLVFRRDQQRFYQAYEIADIAGKYCIAVDVADINGNGFPEIFVTSMPYTRKLLNSFVVEYDGQAFKKIADDLSWYFRVLDTPDRGKILIGQEHRLGSPFTGSIHEMLWRNGQYEPETPVRARAVNAIGLTIGDILDDKSETTAAYDSTDRIRLFDASGQELWKSADKYGGSTIYYSGDLTDQGQILNPIYFPMRLTVRKSASDGKTKLLAIQNHDIGGRKLEKFRSFNESQIISFFWDGLGLSPDWKTRKISGYIRDFAVGDFNNDGTEEIVCAVILDEGRIITTSPKSTVIAFELK